YRSGRGTRADVLAMELEIQKLQDRLDENRAAVAASAVALERWIGPAATRPLSEPPRLDVPLPVERLARGELDTVPEV
ncbi:hypothetical protein J8J19_24075, partial [Mycobacterium tuberculosis]|nr:hypothetical protein [Mycobacterium tuberculosis]